MQRKEWYEAMDEECDRSAPRSHPISGDPRSINILDHIFVNIFVNIFVYIFVHIFVGIFVHLHIFIDHIFVGIRPCCMGIFVKIFAALAY